MRTIGAERPDREVAVILGVDTHLDSHVGVAVDHLVHLQDRFRIMGYSKIHENSNLCTFVLQRGA